MDNVLAELHDYMKRKAVVYATHTDDNDDGMQGLPTTSVAASAEGSILPTQTELLQAGRSDLAGALRRHGWETVSHASGLQLSSHARPRSLNLVFCTTLRLASGRMRPYMYWRDFSHLRDELHDVMRLEPRAHLLPPAHRLRALGRSDLVRAIQKHGGWPAVASRLGVRCASVARQQPRAIVNKVAKPKVATEGSQEFEDLRRAVRHCVQQLCIRDTRRDATVMATRRELVQLGRVDLARAVAKAGFRKLAASCGLRMQRMPPPRSATLD